MMGPSCPPTVAQVLADFEKKMEHYEGPVDEDTCADFLDGMGCKVCPKDAREKVKMIEREVPPEHQYMELMQLTREYPECANFITDASGVCPFAMLPKCEGHVHKYVDLLLPRTEIISNVCDERRRLVEGRSLTGAPASLPEPSAYASLLYKTKGQENDEVYVVAFAGTKMSEPEMMQYTLDKEPAYVSQD